MVERKLRTLGITVDLLFPREGAPIPAILTSIAKRGALFAAVISSTNETEGSISVHILWGTPMGEFHHLNILISDGCFSTSVVTITVHFQVFDDDSCKCLFFVE
jgi:hypothetical protein